MPCTVWRKDDVAARGAAALALHIGIATLLRQNRAAGVGAVQMGRRHIAGIVNRHCATQRRRRLQASAKAGIGEQELLAIGKLNRRHVRAGRYARDLFQIGRNLGPLPMMGPGLQLRGGHPALRKRAAGRQFRFPEPRTLRRRIGLRAQPDMEMRRLDVERLHRLARSGGERSARILFLVDCTIHGVTCSSATSLRRTPTPSTSISTTSPAFSQIGGSKRTPAPTGVPVTITSPGSSVV